MKTLKSINPETVERILHVRDVTRTSSTLLILVRGQGWFKDLRHGAHVCPTKDEVRNCLVNEGPFFPVQVTEVTL
jgi:hypothetical protein